MPDARAHSRAKRESLQFFLIGIYFFSRLGGVVRGEEKEGLIVNNRNEIKHAADAAGVTDHFQDDADSKGLCTSTGERRRKM